MKIYRGFTLLELLIAISLLGMLMVLLFSAFRLGNRSWEAGNNKANANTEVRILHRLLTKQLQSLHRNQANRSNFLQQPVLQGDAEQLTFLAPAPAQALVGGLYWHHLYLKEIETESFKQSKPNIGLYLSLQLYHPDFASNDKDYDQHLIPAILLLDNIATLKFSYFGMEQIGSAAIWWEQWQEQTRQPLLIRLNIKQFDDHELELTLTTNSLNSGDKAMLSPFPFAK